MRRIARFVFAALNLAAVLHGPSQVVISEFQADNTFTLKDEDDQSEDWIELCNQGDTAVNLQGWSLTDDLTQMDKWTFPATNLGPNQFMVVFSSGKDRRIPGRPLHTNFKLGATGEYLALVMPDGKTIAPGLEPAYPPQTVDISYGLPVLAQSISLLEAGALGRFLMPVHDKLGTGWTGVEFDDASWVSIRSGVGFERGGYSAMTTLLGSEVGGWMQGVNASAYLRFPFAVTNLAKLDELKLRIRYNDGFIAYLNGMPVAWRQARMAAAGGVLADSMEDWTTQGRQGENNWFYGYYHQAGDTDGIYDPDTDFKSSDPHWNWNGGAWVLGPSNPPWDMISMNEWQPNGSNSGGSHWVVRRWVSETSGSVTCHLAAAKKNAASGTGATLRILRNGAELYSMILGTNTPAGVNTNLLLGDLHAGDFLDFALDPRGVDGSASDSGDASIFVAVIEQSPSEGSAWNSPATRARSLEESVQAEEIDLTPFKGHLVTGTNILAVHGMNASAEDGSFLILPELTGVAVQMSTGHSVYFTSPTPGEPNGPGSITIGPLISSVQHTPNMPADTEDLIVQARVTPTRQPVKSVLLKYRVMFGLMSETAMQDDGENGDREAGDGVYTGRIPAGVSKAGQMIRYSILATDNNDRETKSPPFPDAKRSPQYYGTVVLDPSLLSSRLPTLHWFIQSPSAANSDVPARCSLYYNGNFYDNIGASIHGQSTRGFPKKSYDLNFNPGHHFQWSIDHPKVDRLHLLTTWADKAYMRNVLAHETYREAGAPSHFAFAARLQQNGSFFSVVNAVENGDEYFLERLGLDPRGALYKMYSSGDSASGNEKKTRQEEGTADLQALITGLSQSHAQSRQAYLFDHLNVPEMVNFLAAKIITADTDCCHKNYYLYRDSDGTGEWQAMPWDVDLSFGRVWTCGSPCLNYFDPVLYTNQSIFIGNGNTIFSRIYETPATRQMFLRRLRTLMDSLLQPPEIQSTHDLYRFKILSLRDQIAPDAALDRAKWGTWGARETITQAVDRIFNEFFPGRRAYLFQRQSVNNRGEIPLAQPTNAVVQFGSLEYRPASRNPIEEWLSLTNDNSYAVDLSGWRLEGGVRFDFRPGTVIPPHSALFVSPDVKAFRQRSVSPKGGERLLVVGPYDGNLSAWGESLRLVDLRGRLVSSNLFIGNPSLAQRYLRITELMFDPDPMGGNTGFNTQQFEYIELRNTGPEDLDLRGVRFTEGIHFDFSAGSLTRLAAGERLLLVSDTNAFTLRYGAGWPVAGSFNGSLDNGGERLRLEDTDGEKILDFSYDNAWHPGTEGQGFSLVIRDAALPWSSWGERMNWVASTPSVYRSDALKLNECFITLAGTGYRLRYAGTPRRMGEIQKSVDLNQWEPLWKAQIPLHGIFEYVETNATAKTIYYRAIQQ